ncbi:hypothetical protein VST7929_00643 [Vibrio stylophorae]|uniref:Zinc ribbon domain-containing protein n=1 Tax=Vibrio stylophorae TaxID=659351 RepID=A0ABM8ZR78_9VIBR|nr:zinc-ribbon domain-containing protein [Vibrio stylophorae]CAH0532796.1 hypothetical protein VST7929_00643 [Vibrio stylophorae]
MALINCPECNKEISDTADHCIHCGYTPEMEAPKKGLIDYAFFLFAFAAVGYAAYAIFFC